MRVQDHVIQVTEFVVGNLYRNVARTPTDKLEWRVLDVGRTILNQLQECAQSPLWTIPLLSGAMPAEFDPEKFAEMTKLTQQWDTVEKCENAHKENLEKLFEVIRSLPDDKLDQSVKVPFSDQPVPMCEILMFHYWNVVYHTGQIMFIQTLYGDQDMAF